MKKKSILSLILCIILLVAMCQPASAMEIVEIPENPVGINYSYNSEAQTLTPTEANSYDIYELDLSDFSIPETTQEMALEPSVKNAILALCDYVDTNVVGEFSIETYSSSILEDYLFNCKEITDISILNDLLYIYYNTINDEMVILCYDDQGLREKTIYDASTDALFNETASEATITSAFREGYTYELSDELLNEIYVLLENGDFESLNNIDGLNVNVDEDGLITVEPQSEIFNDSNISTYNVGFKSESAMLSHLKSKFPLINNTVRLTRTEYAPAIGINVSTKVLEDRNEYVKKKASFGKFAAETSITVISAFLGLGTATTIIKILTRLGIGISAANYITSAVTLYKSAVYTFTGCRWGRVYDSVTHKKELTIVEYRSTGEFTGGYDANDEFTWVISTQASALERTPLSIAQKAHNNYVADILDDGVCSLYLP